ncbi:MAG TPA: PCRF domain-containing protein, partial [bacterium]|nr:PCRF domain-containing protein [bacterium]
MISQELKQNIESLRILFKWDEKKQELEELKKETSKPEFWQDQSNAKKINKRINFLTEWFKDFQDLDKKWEDIKVLDEFAEEAKDKDSELEREREIKSMTEKISGMKLQLQFRDESDTGDAIITLHAGAGGTEACDWAEMLLRMYMRWCERKKYEVEVTEVLPGEEAGIKRVTFLVKGPYAYGYLKSEIGVHRLVRISPFDANKRRHTSFAACDVTPLIEEDKEVNIDEDDLKIDTFRSGGKGGQHVNKTESAIRITHVPSGIVV